jgi:hypothetical protein
MHNCNEIYLLEEEEADHNSFNSRVLPLLHLH